MIQPKTYPEFVGQALVLEPDPFVAMVDDDNPWIEGLFLTVSVGVLIGVAQILGSLLLTASLPPSQAVLETLMQAYRRFGLLVPGGANSAPVEPSVRQALELLFTVRGYGSGWLALLSLVVVPLSYVFQWLYLGLVGHGIARLMGGGGSLNQTLGAMALVVAPRLLLLVTVVPFASVSGALLSVWGLLIAFRALTIAHEFSWQRAATSLAILVAVTGLLLAFLAVAGGALLVTMAGGAR